METIAQLLNQKGFLKSLFDSIPCGVLIVDQDRRVHAINNVLERAAGVPKSEEIKRRSGEVLKCIHALQSEEGCGFSEECQSCIVRNTADKAFAGETVRRNKAKIRLLLKKEAQQRAVLVSAAPVDYNNERFAIVIIEDISELHQLRQRLKSRDGYYGIVGRDGGMYDLFETIEQVSQFDFPVLIQGESGTGKELVASAIHNQGSRANQPFVPVNCGALPEGLLESELFGHVKGAFTGALRDKKGRFELAHGGTLFLDEVVDLSKVVQAKLLRVLQTGVFERVGDEKTISVDVRIISAANRDLKKEVLKGNFREDLYYRINVVPIHMPPLRERKKDIPLLIDHFLGQIRKDDDQIYPSISDEALARMMVYPWPGNVRELQNAIQFAIVKCKGTDISPDDLPIELQRYQGPTSRRGPARKLYLDAVKEALEKTGGNKAKAARLLGVGRATLYRFLSEYPEVIQGNN
jgi:transcriptional regulator with PAS, ATPase and Fis domain